jgi:hypothetical protein
MKEGKKKPAAFKKRFGKQGSGGVQKPRSPAAAVHCLVRIKQEAPPLLLLLWELLRGTTFISSPGVQLRASACGPQWLGVARPLRAEQRSAPRDR